MNDAPDTPRVNAFLRKEHVAHDGMWCDFARELERENAKLREVLDLLLTGDLPAALSLARKLAK